MSEKIFSVSATTSQGIQSAMAYKSLQHPYPLISGAIPPEFEGPGGAYSPEDLYAMALAGCFSATFKYVAEKSRLQFEKLDVHCTLVVDKADRPAPWMAKALFKITLQTPTPERGQSILQKVEKNCMILNSVATEKEFSYQVFS